MRSQRLYNESSLDECYMWKASNWHKQANAGEPTQAWTSTEVQWKHVDTVHNATEQH